MNATEYINLKKLSTKAGLLTLSGELTVRNAAIIKENVLEATQVYQELEILIDHPEAIDITIFQLLEASRKHMEQAKKKLVITLNLTDDAQELWRKAGLN